MSTVAEAAGQLVAALETVPDVGRGRVVVGMLAPDVQPLAIVIGLPRLQFRPGQRDPIEATFVVFVIEQADERSLERLATVAPYVVQAIHNLTEGSVGDAAEPTSYKVGTTELPAYAIPVEFPLRGEV